MKRISEKKPLNFGIGCIVLTNNETSFLEDATCKAGTFGIKLLIFHPTSGCKNIGNEISYFSAFRGKNQIGLFDSFELSA